MKRRINEGPGTSALNEPRADRRPVPGGVAFAPTFCVVDGKARVVKGTKYCVGHLRQKGLWDADTSDSA